MVHRDPQTGEFVADSDQFDDIEVATFETGFGVEASNLGGGTGFGGGSTDNVNGLEVVDYDDIVDRNEGLHLLAASHVMVAYVNSTETADGTVRVVAEISASPTMQGIRQNLATASQGQDDIVGNTTREDTIDIVGRPLVAVGHAPFSDGATGTGGGGSAGEDHYDGNQFPAEFGRFHPRDELFVNASVIAWNIDDAAVHADIQGQHVYGVIEE